MEDPVTETVMKFFLERVIIFRSLCANRRKTKGDVPEKIDTLRLESTRRGIKLAEGQDIRRPGVPEIPLIENTHSFTADKKDAQDRFFKTKVPEDLPGDLLEGYFGDLDTGTFLMD